MFIPLNIGFKTNLILDKADELFIGQQHLFTPNSMDAVRLFTPISALGVFYIIVGTMKMITQVGGQYAIKVSYSKDRVLPSPLRNSSSSSASTTTDSSRKTSTKLPTSKSSPPGSAQEPRT